MTSRFFYANFSFLCLCVQYNMNEILFCKASGDIWPVRRRPSGARQVDPHAGPLHASGRQRSGSAYLCGYIRERMSDSVVINTLFPAGSYTDGPGFTGLCVVSALPCWPVSELHINVKNKLMIVFVEILRKPFVIVKGTAHIKNTPPQFSYLGRQ